MGKEARHLKKVCSPPENLELRILPKPSADISNRSATLHPANTQRLVSFCNANTLGFISSVHRSCLTRSKRVQRERCCCFNSMELDLLWCRSHCRRRFTATDTPDANGGFLITAITGLRNGITITGLQPTGTAIPGNEPYAVDNLISLGPGPQLTKSGFGFSTADGNFSNPFFADFLPSPEYLEFFSTPPFTDDGQGPGDSELPVQFNATPVPEPAPFVLASVCLHWQTRVGKTRVGTRRYNPFCQ